MTTFSWSNRREGRQLRCQIVTAQDREGRVPEPAEAWALARVETKAPVAVDKANGPDVVAAAARVPVAARDRVAPSVEVTGKMDFRVFK